MDDNPTPQPADAALLAKANRALHEQLEEARAEVARLHRETNLLIEALHDMSARHAAQLPEMLAEARAKALEDAALSGGGLLSDWQQGWLCERAREIRSPQEPDHPVSDGGE